MTLSSFFISQKKLPVYLIISSFVLLFLVGFVIESFLIKGFLTSFSVGGFLVALYFIAKEYEKDYAKIK